MIGALLDCAAYLVVGLESAERLPNLAAEALLDGCDSPALRTLAGMRGVRAEELVPVFEQALLDMGLRMPRRRDAVLRLARLAAEQILQGELTPYQGSKRIWELTLLDPEEVIAELDPFIYAASEWEERPKDRKFFERSIMETAKELVRDAR